MARVVPRNSIHAPTGPRPSSETVPNSMGTATRSFPSSSTIEERGLVSTIGIATRTRTVARIAMSSTLTSTSALRIGVGQLSSPSNLPRGISHSNAPFEPQRLRTIRGAKRQRRYQRRQTPFVGDDYDIAMACLICMNMDYVMLRAPNEPKNLSPVKALCAFEV